MVDLPNFERRRQGRPLGPPVMQFEWDRGESVHAIHADGMSLGLQTDEDQTVALATIVLTVGDEKNAIYASFNHEQLLNHIERAQHIADDMVQFREPIPGEFDDGINVHLPDGVDIVDGD